MKITEQILKEIIREQLNEAKAIGSHGDPVQHLHNMVEDYGDPNLNQIAGYLAGQVYLSNYKQDEKGFMDTLFEEDTMALLKELQGELSQAVSDYTQSLKGVSAKWLAVTETIGNSLVRRQRAAGDKEFNEKYPEQAVQDRMQKAYANREQDPEEYKAARQAWQAANSAARGR